MKSRVVNDRYRLVVPDHVADWDAPSSWERARFASMEEMLRPGMTLLDVGAEHGWISAIYAGFVGGENMVLVEPTCEFWPNIRLTWEANGLPGPKASLVALLGEHGGPANLVMGGWPECAAGGEAPAGGYRYLHEPAHVAFTEVATLDCVAAVAGVDAVTVDVEGAELAVLRGAEVTLRESRPVVWVSIHPDLMARDYGVVPDEVHRFMGGVGYVGDHLGTDHEEHWCFTPR